MKVLVMAGGTGGHVFPALAVAQMLRAEGHEIEWMGTRAGLESRVVPAAGFRLHEVHVQGLRGSGVARLLRAPFVVLRAVWQALRVLRSSRPAMVLGMGGFTAGPGGVAARLLRRPLVIHEQNAIAGMTNRWLARFATRVLQAFDGALPAAETVGNPVRAAFDAVPPPESRARPEAGPLHLLVVGGSQGARALNATVPAALALLPEGSFRVTHQGGRTVDVARAAYAQASIEADVIDFIEDMPAAFAATDLVICRAGAMTVAEIAATGVAALFVPFPAAVDDHQTHNAQQLVRADAAVLLPEAELTPQRLADQLQQLSDRDRLARMAMAARACARPDSCRRIADICLEVART